LPMTWRLETARALIALLGERVHSDLVMQAGKLLADGRNSSHVVIQSPQAVALLKAYLRISDPTSDAWIKGADAIASAWLRERLLLESPIRPPWNEVLAVIELTLIAKNRNV